MAMQLRMTITKMEEKVIDATINGHCTIFEKG